MPLIDENNFREFAKETLTALAQFQESLTMAVRVITTDHSYIHDGIGFSANDKRTMTPGQTAKISIKTPSSALGTFIHFRPAEIITSGDNLTATLYEDNSEVTAGGTITAYNRNRTNSYSSQLTLKSTATITTAGTAIDAYYVGGGTSGGKNSLGAEISSEHEIVLKQNSNYSLVVYNGSTSSNTVFIKMFWYEEEQGG